jgi:hypothetical protein
MGWLETERREGNAQESGIPAGRVSPAGVRAPILAMKRRNGRGAKGGRKVDV